MTLSGLRKKVTTYMLTIATHPTHYAFVKYIKSLHSVAHYIHTMTALLEYFNLSILDIFGGGSRAPLIIDKMAVLVWRLHHVFSHSNQMNFVRSFHNIGLLIMNVRGYLA